MNPGQREGERGRGGEGGRGGKGEWERRKTEGGKEKKGGRERRRERERERDVEFRCVYSQSRSLSLWQQVTLSMLHENSIRNTHTHN